MSLKNRARESSLESLDGPVATDPGRRASGVQARAEHSLPALAANAASDLPLISIGSPPDPALLEPTYAYLSAYCCAFLPPPVAERMNGAIYEFFANALCYRGGGAAVAVGARACSHP